MYILYICIYIIYILMVGSVAASTSLIKGWYATNLINTEGTIHVY